MIRQALQAGKGRKIFGLLGGLATAFAILLLWDELARNNVNPLEIGQKIAFVAAAFSVTAYNLRTRVVDLVLKVEAPPEKTRELTRISRECGKKLTNLVCIFTISALLLGGGGFFSASLPLSKTCSFIVYAFFGFSCVQFLYVLFAFERLERFALDEAEEASNRRETNRLIV